VAGDGPADAGDGNDGTGAFVSSADFAKAPAFIDGDCSSTRRR
jgi:hypothetical protein